MPTYSFSQLAQIWIANGGSGGDRAKMAAAVAIAESGGRSDAKGGPNRDGSYDWGAWQINNGGPDMFDINKCAKRAILMSANGSNWRPWCTAYSDNACGTRGGKYMSAGSRAYDIFRKEVGSDIPLGPGPLDPGSIAGDALGGVMDIPKFLSKLADGKTWVRATEIFGGVILIVLGVVFMAKETQAGKVALKAAKDVGGGAAGGAVAAAI